MGRDGDGFLSWLKPLVALKRRVLRDIFYPRCVASGLCKEQGGQAGFGGGICGSPVLSLWCFFGHLP
jgi:hypothetical protein